MWDNFLTCLSNDYCATISSILSWLSGFATKFFYAFMIDPASVTCLSGLTPLGLAAVKMANC
jgi:hypothetical protein